MSPPVGDDGGDAPPPSEDPFRGVLPLPRPRSSGTGSSTGDDDDDENEYDYDVIVSGAGPVGLLLGCALRTLGVTRVALIDPHLGAGTGGSKAAVIMPRTLEAVARSTAGGAGRGGGGGGGGGSESGVAPALRSAGRPVKSARIGSGGTWLGRLDGFDGGYGEEDSSSRGCRYGPMFLGQDKVESELSRRYVEELGGTMYRAARVVSISEDEEEKNGSSSGGRGVSVGVERSVYVRPPAAAPEIPPRLKEVESTTLRARYVVGADGKNSTVREELGVGYVGKEYDQVFFLADVEVAEGEAERRGFDCSGAHVTTESDGTLILFVRIQGNVVRTYYCRDGIDTEQCTEEFLRSEWEKRVPGGFGMKIVRFEPPAVFKISCRLAAKYASAKSGRVLLAGDAAHCHSPAGGQGMNTGLQDAANLAWRLADAVERETAAGKDGGKEGDDADNNRLAVLLAEQYEAERRPVAEWVLSTTDAAFSDMTKPYSRIFSALRNAAIRLVLAVAPSGYLPPTSLRDRMFGLSLSYRAAGTCVDSGEEPPKWWWGNPLVAGDRLPDLPHLKNNSDSKEDGDSGQTKDDEKPEYLHDLLGPLSSRHTLLVVSGGPGAEEDGGKGGGESAAGRAVAACVAAASDSDRVSDTVLAVFSSEGGKCASSGKNANEQGDAKVRVVELVPAAGGAAGGTSSSSLASLLGLGTDEAAVLAVRPDAYLSLVHRGPCDRGDIESGLGVRLS